MQTILKFHNLNIEKNNDYESVFTTQFTKQHCCIVHVFVFLNFNENNIEFEIKFNEEKNINIMFIEKIFNKDYDKNFILKRILIFVRKEINHFKNLTLIDCKKIKNKLYYRNRKYVSIYHAFKLRLLKLHHDNFVENHQNWINIYELLFRNYYWLNIQDFVKKYCNHYDIYRRSKFSKFKKQKVLKFLSIFQRRWQNINIDLITKLSKINDNNVICNIIDKFTKKRHHISCNIILNFEDLIVFFMKYVWCRYDFFESIISNRNSQFINDFWQRLCKRFNIEIALFIVWHFKIDDQIERFNDVMKQYLRIYVNYNQNDWFDWLFLAKFVDNNIDFNIIKISLFYVNKEFHFRMNVEFFEKESYNQKEVAIDQFASRMQKLKSLLKEQMIMIQTNYEQYVNKFKVFVSLYKIDDMIYFNTKNIITRRFCLKLNHKNIDSHWIVKMMNSIFVKLNFLFDIQDLYSIFHVHLLSSIFKKFFHSNYIKRSLSTIFIDAKKNQKWKIETIFNFKYDDRFKKLKYRIKWIEHIEIQWKNYIYLKNASNIKAKFHQRYFQKIDFAKIKFNIDITIKSRNDFDRFRKQ